MDDCIFCKIIKGEIPCYKVYEDSDVLAFLDIAQDFYGHTLVIPKKHCTNILDCDSDILNKVINVVQKISNHYVNDCNFKGVNILNANNKEAQQSVFHLHFHIIPRNSASEFDVFPRAKNEKFPLDEQLKRLKMD